MNILIVHNYYQVPGGEDTVVNNEKHLLEANGHNVVLYTRNNSEIKNISKLKKILLPFSAFFSMRTYFEVRQIIKEKNIVEIQAVGAGAINQAVKAIAIARGFVAPSGRDIVCIPAFTDIEIDGEERTAIKLIVQPR